METGCWFAAGSSLSSALSAASRPRSRTSFSMASQYSKSDESKRDARGRPSEKAGLRSGSSATRPFACERTHDIHCIPRNAQVGGTLVECLGPEFIVCQSMSADDVKTGEFIV